MWFTADYLCLVCVHTDCSDKAYVLLCQAVFESIYLLITFLDAIFMNVCEL